MYRFQEPDSPSPGNLQLPNTGLSADDESSFSDIWQNSLDTFEDTAAVEFTAEIHAPLLTATKPRRARKTAAFEIHEDTKGESKFTTTVSSRLSGDTKTGSSDGKPTILCQPAQRFQRPKNSLALNSSHGSRSRTALKSNVNSLSAKKRKTPTAQKKEKTDVLKKDVHRETVYIPSDTTTLPSAFMGLFSPLKPQNPHGPCPPQSEDCQTNREIQGAKKQRLRTSVTAPPRRAPLQHTTKFAQECTTTRDVFGKNGGKENIPPGSLETICCMKSGKEENSAVGIRIKSAKLQSTPPISSKSYANRKLLSTTANNKVLANITGRKSSERTQWSGANASSSPEMNDAVLARALKMKPAAVKSSISVSKVCSAPILQTSPTEARVSTKSSLPSVIKACTKQKYPLLTEDISNTAMYEDNWLSHQEIAITQLANSLFDSGHQKLDGHQPDMLLHDLLVTYQDDYFTLLYKRLQASILYGALSVPKDMLVQGNRLKDDLGLKRTFLNLWVETYNLSALRAAAETVIGRKIITPSRNGNISPSHQQKGLKKALEAFLDTFLLRNEDMEPRAAVEWMTGETNLCCGYRRTILRSILMIVLLDRGRLRPKSTLPRLFASSSKYKSSTEAVQALAYILLPSVGDITRPLSHLDCQVTYKQHPLQEYEFRINNLAVDLRDGVLLTRLVELLFYPLVSCPMSQQQRVNESTLRTSNTVKPPLGDRDWPLSQHLKFPCVSRATKLHNVQIALDALFGERGVGSIVKDVSAEDIVDGYREKTIGLLWGLVGKFGLSGLVDWGDVKKEIIRLRRKAASQIGEQECGNDEPSGDDLNTEYKKHIFLLRQWASILAKLRGLRLENLTTSFADGKIFESIVDEYEDYMTSGKHEESPTVEGTYVTKHGEGQSNAVSLRSRLMSLGCSSQFASLVQNSISDSSHYFDNDFTLAALAFLCSRLLSASKLTRAAIIVQSAWRHTLARRRLHHRIVAKQIALQCAAVVHARDRILWAKAVIVKWWRNQSTRKKRRHGKPVHRSFKSQPKSKAISKS
ncbi:hypothetical protein V8E54_006118 [Elaphomyces granulatus]